MTAMNRLLGIAKARSSGPTQEPIVALPGFAAVTRLEKIEANAQARTYLCDLRLLRRA